MSKKSKKPNALNKFDKIILRHVPKFFEILGQTALLGVLQYVANTTNNFAVWTIYGVSLVGMMYYIQVYVSSILPWKVKGRKASFAILLGIVFAISMFQLLNAVLNQMAKASVY